jgi:hypothetical protein
MFFSVSEWYATLQQIRIFGKPLLAVCRGSMLRIRFCICNLLGLWVRIQKVKSRKTREGWPLLTVETEVNGDSELGSTNERGPFLIGSLGLSCRYNRFLSFLGCSSRPSATYFFLAVHFFNSFVLNAHQAGQAAVLVACLLVCVSD